MSLKELQFIITTQLYIIYRTPSCDEAFKEAVKKYDATLAKIVAFYGGEDKTPASEDPDLYEVYHNVYKSEVGCRPRRPTTLAEMKNYLNRGER